MLRARLFLIVIPKNEIADESLEKSTVEQQAAMIPQVGEDERPLLENADLDSAYSSSSAEFDLVESILDDLEFFTPPVRETRQMKKKRCFCFARFVN